MQTFLPVRTPTLETCIGLQYICFFYVDRSNIIQCELAFNYYTYTGICLPSQACGVTMQSTISTGKGDWSTMRVSMQVAASLRFENFLAVANRRLTNMHNDYACASHSRQHPVRLSTLQTMYKTTYTRRTHIYTWRFLFQTSRSKSKNLLLHEKRNCHLICEPGWWRRNLKIFICASGNGKARRVGKCKCPYAFEKLTPALVPLHGIFFCLI